MEREKLRREREINSLMSDDSCWQDEANCCGDERFTDERFFSSSVILARICFECPVFSECAVWAVGKSGVFAAGEWRDEDEQ